MVPTPPVDPTGTSGPDATDPGAPARPHDRVVGDAAVAEATGRSRSEWFAVLDAAGASGWRHRDVAGWLAREHGVDPWWSQAITVGYEQARGIRVPGQRQDGSFECSVSRTVPLDRDRAYAAVADDAQRRRWLDVPVDVTGATAPASVRWTLPDGTRAVVRVEPVRAGATRVVVQHGRLPDERARAASAAAWRERLGRLADAAAGG